MEVAEMTFPIDLSGFSTCQYTRWFNTKYGREQDAHDWLELHLMCGVTTNIISAVEIMGRGEVADAQRFRPLVQTTAHKFKIRELVADKAYSSRRNLELAEQRGTTPFNPFQSNTTSHGCGSAMGRLLVTRPSRIPIRIMYQTRDRIHWPYGNNQRDSSVMLPGFFRS
jgi:hypothetical protein